MEDFNVVIFEEEVEELCCCIEVVFLVFILEMIGDLFFVVVRFLENILFVCKFNLVMQDEDFELIFLRFGKILSCEVVRDKKLGDSLQYVFIEFDECEVVEQVWFVFFYFLFLIKLLIYYVQVYFKM